MTAPLLLLIVGAPTLVMVTLCLDGLRKQIRQDRAARAEQAETEKRTRINARRRYLYALKHLPRYRISTETVKRGDLL